ncbi:hypothetical protein DDB_G0288303 [Dictyostelium discoideum AX4]|uniref:Putative uncharacterized protein DDB_G0288303 n=1 Tax=Dictyostelium discoideum TaxID=44689 RepID=Y7883_DICDI|nr:hypothetical protein DDB_G0288303 [Dictyostelium discoideum AX4]Q54J44.1 RecName: Full=Putative uncharacterized protein DDB_G0288303 [Dictyostelium discoideum]EAL63294.1 hypothetical protein DDB_G0288303 [Dictyostelium discoideum AX4]|eukprot:XP_636803.1 hypothetical protein DDB_G0288303 [Dictyostelium discoideum AX4]
MWIPIIIPFGLRGKSKLIDNKKRICVNCKNSGVQLVKNDEWFHLFFIPFFKVKNGNMFLHCPSCGATIPYYEKETMPTFNNPDDVKFEAENNEKNHKKGKYDAPMAQVPPEYLQRQDQYPNQYQQQPQQQQPGYMDYNYNQPPVQLNKQAYDNYQQNDYKSNNQPNLAKENNISNENEELGDNKKEKKEKKHSFFSKLHKKEKNEIKE